MNQNNNDDNEQSGIFFFGFVSGVALSYTGILGFVSGATVGIFLHAQSPKFSYEIVKTLTHKAHTACSYIKKYL